MMQAKHLAMPEAGLSSVTRQTGLLTVGEVLLVLIAGVVSAAMGHFLGRMVHAAWPVPLSGSIAVAMPRTMILLMVLVRVDRFGVLTTAGLAEVAAKLALSGSGLCPWFLIVPVLGNFAADLLWTCLRPLPYRQVRLMLTGGSLCAARVLAALFFWSVLGRAFQGSLGVLVSRTFGRRQASCNQ